MNPSRRDFFLKTLRAGAVLTVADNAWSYNPDLAVNELTTDAANRYMPLTMDHGFSGTFFPINISKAKVKSSTGTQMLAMALDSRIIYVESISDMLSLDTDSLLNRQPVSVRSYHGGTNVGGGTFYWDSASDDADNGGTVFKVDGAAGQWKREWSGTILATWFGAIPDAVSTDLHSGTDNSPYQISADEAAHLEGAACVIWPPGRYRFTQPLQRKVPHYGEVKNEHISSSVTFIVDNIYIKTWLTSSGVGSNPQRSHDIFNINFTSAQDRTHKLFDANFYCGRIENSRISRFDIGIDVDGVYVRMKNLYFSSNRIGVYPRPLRCSGNPSTMFDLEECVFLGNEKGFVYENRGLGGEGSNDNDLLSLRFKNCGFEQNTTGLEITQRIWYMTTENCWSESNSLYGINIPQADWNDLNSRWDDEIINPSGNREYFRAVGGTVTTSIKKQLFKGRECASTGSAVLNISRDGKLARPDGFPATASILNDNTLRVIIDKGPDVIKLPVIKCTPIKRNSHLSYSIAFENDFSFGEVAGFGTISRFDIRVFDPVAPTIFVIPDWWAIEISWDTVNYDS